MPSLPHDELTRLMPQERLALIAELWDSLEGEQCQLTTAQADELDQRLTTLDADRRQGVN